MAEVEDKILEQSGVSTSTPKPSKLNSFQMIGDQKIPVSQKRGPLWKARIAAAEKMREEFKDAWNEAVDYFKSDQMVTRNGNRVKSSTIRKDESSEIENVVFSNVMALTPRIFSRNPRIEFTPNFEDPNLKDFVTVSERLINTILSGKSSPGVSLKAKARQAIMRCQLTNLVWAEIDYVKKDMSSDQMYADVQRISKALEKATKQEEIETLEAELAAIDDKYDLLAASGPTLEILNECAVLVDPNATASDFSDAQWMAKEAMFSTKFLQAKYMQKDKQGQHTLIFKPDYVVKKKKSENQEDYSIFDKDDAKIYGYDSQEEYESAKRSKVYYVWDKVTRRVELYLANEMKWPLWVWNDPLSLPNFFPFYPLMLVTPIEGVYAKGEVSYYLDQQDAINDINEHARLARRWARFNIWYNLDLIDEQTMAKVLEGGKTNGAYGVRLGAQGVKMTDAVFSVPPPGVNFMQLFDKTTHYNAIDRIVPVNEAGRGGQFKTNTTNQAISQYAESRTVRVGDKTDIVEDWISDIALGLFQLCLMNMTPEDVAKMLGPVQGKIWQAFSMPIGPEKLPYIISSVTVASGSTQKPNSDEKKREAIDITQVLGQFASATPAAIVIALKALENAFDDVSIKEEDWEFIRRTVEMQIGMSADNTEQQVDGQQQQAQPAAQGGGQIDQFLSQLPPEQAQQVVSLIQSGADPVQAITEVTGQPPPI
jgi:hypothetical protein